MICHAYAVLIVEQPRHGTYSKSKQGSYDSEQIN